MHESMNNPQPNPEIYLEQISAEDGPALAENMWSAPPWISTVRAKAGVKAGAKRRSSAGPEPELNPGEGVPEPNPGGPNRGWDSALLHSV